MKLTFYLFNESTTEFDQTIREQQLDGDDAFQEVGFKVELPFEAKAYFQKNRPTKPKWLDYLTNFIDIDEDEIVNTTNSFLLLIRTGGRIFAITQGFGFTAIDRSRIERGFGLRVVLNEINPEKIKSIDARKIDTTTKQKHIFINRDSPLYDFDFDTDEDLLNLLSGYPSDRALAKKLTGSDSLSLTSDVTFPELGDKCKALLESFNKQNYKENFGFIDYLRIVKENDLVTELDRALRNSIINRQNEGLMLAYPEILDLNQIHYFEIKYDRRMGQVSEVTLDELYNFFDEHEIYEIDPSKVSIIGFDQDSHPVTKKFFMDEFIVYETRLANLRYLYSLKQWFELAENYLREVDDSINAIEVISDIDYLPPMRDRQTEGDYNREVAAANRSLILLDKQNFHLEGYSQVEVCDLLRNNSDLICVKKYNGSSTLSHLFSQGYVSSTLLNDYPEYREFIINKCPVRFGPLPFDRDRLERNNITFVFAIAAKGNDGLTDILPFFSKVNLRQAKRSIERMGYKVKLFKISIE
jgi:uncharacterized protein (TIGR04141 family)